MRAPSQVLNRSFLEHMHNVLTNDNSSFSTSNNYTAQCDLEIFGRSVPMSYTWHEFDDDDDYDDFFCAPSPKKRKLTGIYILVKLPLRVLYAK